MKRKLLVALCILAICLISCQKNEANENLLTGIYAPVLSELGRDDTTVASAMVPVADGYAFVMKSMDEEYNESLTILQLDENGQQREIPVDVERFSNAYMAGQRGIYSFVLAEKSTYMLQWIGWDGTVIAQENISDHKPASATTQTPKSTTNLLSLPMAETEEGLVLTWGKALLYLDKDLQCTDTVELPGQGDMVFVEDSTIWVSYTEKNVRMLGKVQDHALVESFPMPESFYGANEYYYTQLIDCQDGWLYGWDEVGVVRWQFDNSKEEVIETVLDFLHSGLSGNTIRLVTRLDEKRFAIQNSTDDGLHVENGIYEKAPDKDLSQMTVLTVATISIDDEMEKAVLHFNKIHNESYMQIVNYGQYNTTEEPDKGYTLLMTDLTTGILQADILYGITDESALDLYPLMTGTVQKEDIAPCVRRALEQDGKLTSIGATFYVSTLVGKTGEVPEKFTLTEFLDFAGTLQEDEHLMEEVSKDSASYQLFGNHGYDLFLQNHTATFDDPLFGRLLDFLDTLPLKEEKYSAETMDNSDMLLAGEITEEQLVVESGGENLYWNGKIKLTRAALLSSPRSILQLYDKFGTTDIVLTGYPTVTEDQSGIQVQCMGKYSITKNCKDPALAWEYIESILLEGAQIDLVDSITKGANLRAEFTTLVAPYREYLETLRDQQQFVTGEEKVLCDTEIELDEHGWYQGKAGVLLDVGDDLIALVEMLYTEAGNAFSVPIDVTNIITEEVSRYLVGGYDAASCADATQSRVQLYWDENA